MNILANIENIEYEPLLCSKLNKFRTDYFDLKEVFQTRKSKFLIDDDELKIAVSKWVSPKRTRSYPYARIYDTMNFQNRLTIIPLVKDEGKDGDRDYLQWDTVSFMSLLGVYVIIAYYCDAEKNPRYKNKIASQKFDYGYLIQKFEELRKYKSDALHWNLKQLSNLSEISERCRHYYYDLIASKCNVKMHGIDSFNRKMEKISDDVETFKKFSRKAAQLAQDREYYTEQPKEMLIEEKAKITITNYLGGMYYFTVDEVIIKNEYIFLIEKKHSRRSMIPSLNDIKDGLLKLILHNNFSIVSASDVEYKPLPVLGLTSDQFDDAAHNFDGKKYPRKIERIFEEGRKNNFLIFLMDSRNPDYQAQIIDDYLSSI